MFNKKLPLSIIEFESKRRSQAIYEKVELLAKPDNDSMKNSKFSPSSQTGLDAAAKDENKGPRGDAKSLIKVWLNLKNPFLTQGQLFQIAGIKSGSKQVKIKKELIRLGIIKEHKLQKGKTYLSIWEPTEKAYLIAGIAKPKYASKGGYLHQFIAHHLRQWAQKTGYSVVIEFFLSNNKAVDEVLRKESSLIFCEIGISPPIEKEMSNIIKDFETDLIPDKLIMAVKNGSMKRKLEKLIENDNRLFNYRHKIEVILAGNIIQNTNQAEKR